MGRKKDSTSKLIKSVRGQRLRIARIRSKITVHELGSLIGLSDKTIESYEAGINSFENSIQELASILNCNPDYLMTKSDLISKDSEIIYHKALFTERWLNENRVSVPEDEEAHRKMVSLLSVRNKIEYVVIPVFAKVVDIDSNIFESALRLPIDNIKFTHFGSYHCKAVFREAEYEAFVYCVSINDEMISFSRYIELIYQYGKMFTDFWYGSRMFVNAPEKHSILQNEIECVYEILATKEWGDFTDISYMMATTENESLKRYLRNLDTV